jgi:uracil-DNA glycosylase family 4
MVLGKMPGYEEERFGLNLVGPSGMKLKEMLERYGVTEYGSWYVTNLMKFPHPGRDRGEKDLKAYWLKDCKPLLWQEIRLLRPKFILCLGTEAAKEMLGEFGGIQMSSNKVHSRKTIIDHVPGKEACPACQGTGGTRVKKKQPVICPECMGWGKVYNYHHFKVMTCVHPAYVLHTPDAETQFAESIKMFCRLVREGGVDTEEHDLDYVTASDETTLEREVARIIARTPEVAVTAVDAEWHGEHPWDTGAYLRTVQISDQPKYALCVELTGQGGVPVFKNKAGEVDIHASVPHLKRLLKSTPERRVRLVGHFFRSDMPQIKHHLGIDLMPEHEAPAGEEDDAPFRTKDEGGFDTGLSAHAVREADEYKLEVVASRHTDMIRWDGKLLEWKKRYCAENNMDSDDMEGYGECPADILIVYSQNDVDATRRLFDVFNGLPGKPGLLDYDDFGLCSRRAFWIAMRAMPAAAEMEATGLLVDKKRAEQMLDIYLERRNALLETLRKMVKWDNFNIDSPFHVRELLFGVGYSGTLDREKGGMGKRVSPEGAELCGLTPIKPTGDDKKSWADLVREGKTHQHMASTDKESLGILAAKSPIARKVRDVRFLNQLLKTTLRRPKENITTKTVQVPFNYPSITRKVTCKKCKGLTSNCEYCGGTGQSTQTTKARSGMRNKKVKVYNVAHDEDGNRVFDKGLLSYISWWDGRIHTTLYQTLEMVLSTSKPAEHRQEARGRLQTHLGLDQRQG